jgi:hypothetical protein
MYGISQLEGLAVIWVTDKFRPYLSHQKFTLVTDHRALTKLREVKDNNPMLYRWSLKLAGYDYEFEYKKGEKHGNADGPSRNPVLNINKSNVEESEANIADPNETPLQRFWRLQNNDLWCKNLIRKVHTKGNLILDTSKGTGDFEIKEQELRKNDHEAWVVKEGTLWHRLYRNGETITRSVIPTSMRKEILAMVHNQAHLGFKKTYATASSG